MQKKSNRYSFVSEEKKQLFLTKIIGFFQDQRNEQIGVIAAQETLEFFIDLLGDELYLKAVTDCKNIVKQRNEDVEIELASLTPVN